MHDKEILEQEKIQFDLEKTRFAKDSVGIKNSNKKGKKINISKIVSAMENPYNNYSTLQEISLYLKNHCGVYARILNYFSTMLTYDFMLYPIQLDSKKLTKDKLQKGYQEAALYLEKLNVKYNLTWFAKRIFELGELYLYKIEDKEGIIFKEMPNDLCRVSSIQNNICKYSINLSKIASSSDIYNTMPKEIQNLADRYKNGLINKDKLIDYFWYELDDNAYAFNIISQFLPKGFPVFSYMFEALVHLMELEELEFTNAKVDNLKIIHQKLPMDDEGNLLISLSEARQYHESTKANLPNGIAITTNPLDLQALTLHRNGSQSISHRANAIKSIFDISGVNDEIFNGNNGSEMAIASGVKADELLVLELTNMFENFLNYILCNNKKTLGWRIKILPLTHFSKDAKIKSSRENLAYGGSRMEFLATNGYTPIQSLNILKGEQLLGFDELLIPQATSHTMQNNSYESTSVSDGVAKTMEESKPSDSTIEKEIQ